MNNSIKNTDARRALQAFEALYHDNAKSLTSMRRFLRSSIEYMGADPFPVSGVPLDSEIHDVFLPYVESLRQALHDLIAELRRGTATNNATTSQIANISKKINGFKSDFERYPASILPATMRKHIRGVRVILTNLKKTRVSVSNNRLKAIDDACQGVMRAVCFYNLRVAVDQILAMDQQALALREIVTAATHVSEEGAESPKEVRFMTILESAIQSTSEYAESRRLGWKMYTKNAVGLLVRADHEKLARAIRCILENAVKYNKQTTAGDAWITVRSRRRGKCVELQVESWGVPIMTEEIKEGLVYQYGYRGIYAKQGARVGTGLGLHYAKSVVQSHGGSIGISSVPAKRGADPSNYDQEFLTTVTIQIPLLANTRALRRGA